MWMEEQKRKTPEPKERLEAALLQILSYRTYYDHNNNHGLELEIIDGGARLLTVLLKK